MPATLHGAALLGPSSFGPCGKVRAPRWAQAKKAKKKKPGPRPTRPRSNAAGRRTTLPPPESAVSDQPPAGAPAARPMEPTIESVVDPTLEATESAPRPRSPWSVVPDTPVEPTPRPSPPGPSEAGPSGAPAVPESRPSPQGPTQVVPHPGRAHSAPTGPPSAAPPAARPDDDRDAYLQLGPAPARPATTSAPRVPPIPDSAVAAESSRPPGAEPWLDLSAAVHLFTRDLSYRDDIFFSLRPYVLLLGPAIAVSATAYPAALLGDGAASRVGIGLAYEHAVGLTSVDTSDPARRLKFPTTSNAFRGGVQYRHPAGAFDVAVRAGFGWRSYAVDNAADRPKPPIPSVFYSHLFVAGGGRWRVHRAFSLDATVGWRQLVGTGEFGAAGYFPRARGGGVEASLGVAIPVRPVEIRASAELERYFFKINPELGDPLIVGGALDQFLGLRVGVGYGLR